MCGVWGWHRRLLRLPRSRSHEHLRGLLVGQEVGGLSPGARAVFRRSLQLCGALRRVCLLLLPGAESQPAAANCSGLRVCLWALLTGSLKPLVELS